MGKEKEDSQKTKIAREETPVTDTLSARQRITASGQSTLELEQVQQQVSEGCSSRARIPLFIHTGAG